MPLAFHIQMYCRYFREVGVPLRLRTDGESEFISTAFQNFMERIEKGSSLLDDELHLGSAASTLRWMTYI